MIIGFVGYARSGKDTAVQRVASKGFKTIAFADALREVATHANPIVGYRRKWPAFWRVAPIRYAELVEEMGYEAAKVRCPEMRRFLQEFATDGIRSVADENFWVDVLDRRIRTDPGDYAISDVRFTNEAQYVVDSGGALIRINRSGVKPINAHRSETELDEWKYDFVIDNNGTLEEFEQRIDMTLEEILGHRI